MNLVRRSGSQVDFQLRTMTYFLKFRRVALLLLSLTLSTQALAVVSFGACHQVKALLSATQLTAGAHAEHHSSATTIAVTYHKHDSDAHRVNVAHDDEANDSSTTESNRVKCAACAGCHLCSAVLPADQVGADIPKSGSTSFVAFAVPRVRNVASGLDRPPRA